MPSKHTIAVSQFIDLKELNPEYVEKPYYVVPENDAQTEAFAVVREALLKSGKAALGKVAFSGREHIVAVAPAGPDSRGMMAYTLRYQSELRNAAEYFRDIKQTEINEDALEMAEALIAKKTAKFDPNKFEDGYETAVRELVEAKVKNLPVPQDEPVASATRQGDQPDGRVAQEHWERSRAGRPWGQKASGQREGAGGQEHRSGKNARQKRSQAQDRVTIS